MQLFSRSSTKYDKVCTSQLHSKGRSASATECCFNAKAASSDNPQTASRVHLKLECTFHRDAPGCEDRNKLFMKICKEKTVKSCELFISKAPSGRRALHKRVSRHSATSVSFGAQPAAGTTHPDTRVAQIRKETNLATAA